MVEVLLEIHEIEIEVVVAVVVVVGLLSLIADLVSAMLYSP